MADSDEARQAPPAPAGGRRAASELPPGARGHAALALVLAALAAEARVEAAIDAAACADWLATDVARDRPARRG